MSPRKQATREVRSITAGADGTPVTALIGHATRNADGSWAIKLTSPKTSEPATCVRRRDVVDATGT